MSDEAGSSHENTSGRPADGSASNGSTSASASGSIGSLHTPTATPAGRLSSLRGGRGGGVGAASSSTRGGGEKKMKFVPTVPSKRNKKDAAPSLLDEARAVAGSESGPGSGRGGRGRGGARGRGRGRGHMEDVVATASGPFSLGPAAYARSRPVASGGGASGAHSSYTGVQAIKVEGGEGLSGEDREYYGAAAVDMKFGTVTVDASVPTGLENPNAEKSTGAGSSIKKEKSAAEMDQYMDGVEDDKESGAFDDNSYGTSAEELADIKRKYDGPAQDLLPKSMVDQIFFFQFPSVMPDFKPRVVTPGQATATSSSIDTSSASSPASMSMYSTPDATDKMEDSEEGFLDVKSEPIDVDRPNLIPDHPTTMKSDQDRKHGLLAAGSSSAVPAGQRMKSKAAVKQEKDDATSGEAGGAEGGQTQKEGQIGRLLIYKSGKVKMQVGDIVMDVSSGSECSFLQDVVVVDSNSKEAFVMGSVQKRLVCVPNLTQLLSGLEAMDV
ncbi:hypothetical protein BGZ99_008184 [Dissophora globulifera]|uniref:RNA polymerase III RPC4-domain-containing protein n=1 Tax=Dissophora globulifera TaxID=979702 RepID=A0A9P6RT63_9FUNG|nr:hypothetical protein BGZ99_008184 [Dissophora globulifera]